MATTTLTKENFEDTIVANDIVLIDFWAEWCGPCRKFGPIFEEVSEKHSDIVFGKVDTEAQQELAGTFQVMSIPTLMVFREKVLLYAQPGAVPGEALESLISQVRDLDMAEVHRKVAEYEAQDDGESGGREDAESGASVTNAQSEV